MASVPPPMRRAIVPLLCAALAMAGLVVLRLRAPPRVDDEAQSWSHPRAGVVFGPPDAPTGGEIVVGRLIPTPPPRRLADLAPPGTWDAFELADGALGEAEARRAVLTPAPEPTEELDDGGRYDAYLDRARRRREAGESLARTIAARTRVRVVIRDVVAADAADLSILLVENRAPSAHDLERLVALRDAGTRVVRVDNRVEATPPEFDGRWAQFLPGDPGNLAFLFDVVVEAIRSSPLLVRLPADPLELLEARRDGDDVVVRLRERPTSASLRDLGDREVASIAPGADGTLRVRCPDPGLDPRAHRVVVRTTAGGVEFARAWTVADLVGALDRRVVAANVAEAGAPYAPRVVFTNSKTGGPVAGASERLALVVGDRTITEARGTTDALGLLDVRLAIPEDAPAGPAVLVVGAERFPIEVRTGVRVSVVTDRAAYRPTDDVHTRALVHRAASGRPVAGVEVVLRMGDTEQRVTTSAHGVASADFHLAEQRPRPLSVTATVAGATASASFHVRYFETPTFTIACEPASLRLHASEADPVTVVARYVNGSPVVGATVFAWCDGDSPQPTPRESTTDADGRTTLVLRARADGRGHAVRVDVSDVDGRSFESSIEVVGDERTSSATLDPLEEPIVGRPGRLEVRGEGTGPVVVTIPGEVPQRVELDANGRGILAWTPTAWRLDAVVQSADGLRAYRRLHATELSGKDRFVVLPARRVATVGETLDVEVLGPDGVAFVELARDGTVLRGRLVRVEAGHGHLALPLDAELAGALVLRVGRDDADTPRGTHATVLVNRGRSLRLEARPTQDVWRPGETAAVDVTVADRAGRPTAAVLGYWGVDEALLALAPAIDGMEDAFDVLPARARGDEARDDLARVAAAGERGASVPFASAIEALGPLWPLDGQPVELTVRHRTDRTRERAVRRAIADRFDQSVAACRAAVVTALRTVPPTDVRATGSLVEMLRTFVRDGRLDAARLVDAWGTPFVVGYGFESVASHDGAEPDDVGTEHAGREDTALDDERAVGSKTKTGIPWRSAGPDLVLGTADDLVTAWRPISPADVGGRAGRWLAYVLARAVVVTADDDRAGDLSFGPCAEEFEGPANRALLAISGGAGGSFKGRGGHRNLRSGGGGAPSPGPVRVRRDFQPTLCFVPEAIVGPDGKARLELPLKDSITTWRLRLVASAADGATGIGETRLRVTQPLHLEPWVAGRLTVGDDLELPVAVRNETEASAAVRVRLVVSPEIDVVGAHETTVDVAAGGTGSVVFRLRAVAPGTARLRIDGGTGVHTDAVERVVVVRRDTREIIDTLHGTLGAGPSWAATFPSAAWPGPVEQSATLYGSRLADLLGGLEGLMAAPHGCFEQTSATVYPMVLALDYLRATGRDHPDVERRAREHLAKGYEQLARYEVEGEPGGFDLWGKAPASLFLTAYALHEFHDLARVHPVDPALRSRIASWLAAKQHEDGSWSSEGADQDRAYSLTAYVAWGMARAHAPSAKATAFLEANARELPNPYGLALAALALLTTDATSTVGRALVDRLVKTAQTDAHGAFWRPTGETLIGARGESAAIETTALVVEALLLDGRHVDLAAAALEHLAAWRGPDGRFGTTQATVLALQAFLAAEERGSTREDVEIAVQGAGPVRTVRLSADSTSPARLDLAGAGREPVVFTPKTITPKGKGRARVTVSRTTWVPWSAPRSSPGRLALDVRWPVDVLVAGRMAVAEVEVRNTHAHAAATAVTVEVGIPPGCDIDPEDVRGEGAERVERDETAIVIYLRDLPARATRSFEIPFRPRYALDVHTAPSKAYEFYVPEEAVESAPQRVRAQR